MIRSRHNNSTDSISRGKPMLLFSRKSKSVCFGLHWIVIVVTASLVLGGFTFRRTIVASFSSGKNGCLLSFGEYKGKQYTTETGRTVGSPKCLVESRFVRLSQHQVQIPGTSNIITDWLWIDYHDRINVLVEATDSTKADRKFLVFEQTKYALEGRMSLAIVGGIIEPGEEAQDAAKREVEEEMNVQCNNFHFLGRYRTDVNRGMGWTNSFLATECRKANQHRTEVADEVGIQDTEQQALKTISLVALRKAAKEGKFLEIQWTSTVALALLHDELN